MSRHLRDRDVDHVLKLLDGWRTALTWETLLRALARSSGTNPARQTLYRNERIRLAFQAAKERLRRKESGPVNAPTVQGAIERMARLAAENDRLASENTLLLQKFIVWQHNAHSRGISMDMLNAPLPPVDRQRTKKVPKAS